MRVSELMSKNVESVSPDFSVLAASHKMLELNIGSLPVLNDKKLVGIITDRDLAFTTATSIRKPGATAIQDVMSRNVITCYEDDDISDAARLMERHHIRRLAVVDHSNRLTGLLSVDDLARGSHKLAGIVLEAAEAIH